MKKLYYLFMVLVFVTSAFVQNAQADIGVTVTNNTNTTPNLAASYTSLALALADLNAVTAMSGPVILTLAAGSSETAPPTGLTIGSATLNPALSSTNTVTIVKASGTVTLNAGVGTATPASAAPDGILKIVGADYITIDGLTLTDGNAANPATMEFGLGLFKLSLSDGAQNNTIQNCTINVKTINNASGTSPMIDGSVGILMINSTAAAATTALTPTTAAGANSGNKFYANTINGGNYGMGLIGFAGATPFTTCDVNNDVGGASLATGNTIQNFGGGAATNPSAGIRTLAQYSINVSYNTVNNNTGANANHATTFRGIFINTATSASAVINNNTVVLKSGATSSACTAIDNQCGSTATTNTISISNNTVSGAYSTATTGVWSGINNGGTAATVNINGNTLSGFDLAGTGTHVLIETGSPTTATASNNSISSVTRSGASGSWRIIKTTSPTNFTANGNTIEGLSWTAVASTGSISPIFGTSSAVNFTANNNIIRNLSTPTTGTIIGITENGISGLKTIQNNQVYNFSTTAGGAGGASFTGISELTGSTNDISGNQIYSLNSTGTTGGTAGSITGIVVGGGTTNSVYKNRICDLSSTSTNPLVAGITVSSGTTNTIYNNNIGDLRAPAANAANPVIGLNITGGTTDNIYFNTVNLSATSSGALFGSSAISVSTSPTVTLRNNIFHNTSTANSTGFTVAHRRSTTSLTFFAAASNNNLYYAGAPGASNLIFYDGTNSDQTLAAYKTRVASRDAGSVTENLISSPTFLSTACGNGTFLHISATVPTQLESGGAAIAGITDDFDGNTRNASTPDIGSDEFSGIAIDLTAPTIASITLAGNACGLASRNVTALLSDYSGVDNASFQPRIYFRKNAGTYVSAAGSLTSGTVNSGTWTFTINYAVLGGVVVTDVIDYFIVAQDVTGNVGGSPSGGLVLTNVITVTTPPTTPLTYTIQNVIGGSYNVGTGQTYANLTAAIAAYNTSCLSGPVTFLLTDAAYTEAAALTINANPDASAVNTLTIKPSLAATTIAVTGGSTTAIFNLNGADYVILDGSVGNTVNVCCSPAASRDLTITNTNAGASSAVVWLQTNGADGATNNTIKNCNLVGSGNTATLFGVGSGSSTIGTASLGAGNNYNSYINNSISKTQYGIYSQGASAAAKNVGTIILMNLINTASPNNVARGGIWTGFEDNVNISCNQIDGINLASSPDVFGITCGFGTSMSATTFSGNEVTNATITKNVIGNVINSGTFSATGISLVSAASGASVIANNMIYGVIANGTSGDFAGGIVLGGGAGSTTAVYYNTVSMQGTITGTSAATQTSACLAVTNATAPVIDVRDNIFTNTQLGNSGATLRFAAIALGYSSFTSLTSNNNDLWAAGAGPGTYTIGITGTVVAGTNSVTLANWQTTTGKDGASVNVLPAYVSTTDLHLVPAGNPLLVDLGTPLSVKDDIDCNTRSLIATDMGADEFAPPICVTAVGGTASGSTTICGSGTPVITASGFSAGTGSTFQWYYSTVPGDYPNLGTPVAGQTNPSALSAGVVSVTTYYWLRVTCATNVSTDNSTMVTITISPSAAVISGPAAKCAADAAVTLTETGGTGISWIWSNGETTQSVSVNPAATTVYAVTVTSSGPCTAIASKTLTVNPNPAGVTASASAVTVCQGTPFNLFSDAATAGSPTILSEGFESGATGWVFEDSLSTGSNIATQLFHIQAAPYTDATGAATFLNFSINGSKFVYSNPDAGGTGSFTRTKMYSPSFSTVGYVGDATLTFNHVYRYWATSNPPEQVRVSISINGGTTWTDLQSYEGSDKGTTTNNLQAAVATSVTVPAIYMGYSNVKLRWRFISNWGFFWCLDDVLLTGTPASYTYGWTSTPSGFTSSTQNPTGVSQTVATDYLVTVTGIGGCTATATASVGVYPSATPVITPAAPVIIAGAVQQLSAAVTGDPSASITWSPITNLYTTAGLSAAYGGEPLATVYTNSPATITYTAHSVASSGCIGSQDVVVTVNSMPADLTVTGSVSDTRCYNATNVITVAGGVTTFDVTATGSVTFIAGVKISFMPGTTVQSGGYMHGYISDTYCLNPSSPITASATGQEEPISTLSNAWFNLYPNPTSGNFTLMQKGDRTFGTVKVEVYSMKGEKVMTEQMVGEKSHEFSFTSIPAGLYFVKVVADDYVETIKLIKTR
ncbi:MAG: T9SS type A sorting domain-containing protein [Bacteroidales bacterium]